MGIVLKWILALVGLAVIRAALYRTHWGHGRVPKTVVGLALGVVAVFPLWTGSPGARLWLILLAVPVLMPWRQLAMALFERRVRRSLATLAASWGTSLQREGDLFEVRCPARDGRPEIWVGNVLTRVRSLHPGVGTQRAYRMLGFVVRLDREPAFQCALTKGWNAPKYHEKEWRENTTMQGEMFGLSMGDLLAEGGRETGGSAERLTEQPTVADERFQRFHAVRCDNPEAFGRTFQGELLDAFFASAYQTMQYECNVTPTSVNIYTTYCGPDHVRRNVEFLERLAKTVSGGEAGRREEGGGLVG
jgi:hypothetical protein